MGPNQKLKDQQNAQRKSLGLYFHISTEIIFSVHFGIELTAKRTTPRDDNLCKTNDSLLKQQTQIEVWFFVEMELFFFRFVIYLKNKLECLI